MVLTCNEDIFIYLGKIFKLNIDTSFDILPKSMILSTFFFNLFYKSINAIFFYIKLIS